MLDKVYQKNRILSRAAEAACMPYCLTAALTAYASYACAWTGAPLPHWYAAGAWITAGVPAAALLAGAVIGAARILREARTPRRMGIITPDEICRILERGKRGKKIQLVAGAGESSLRQTVQDPAGGRDGGGGALRRIF